MNSSTDTGSEQGTDRSTGDGLFATDKFIPQRSGANTFPDFRRATFDDFVAEKPPAAVSVCRWGEPFAQQGQEEVIPQIFFRAFSALLAYVSFSLYTTGLRPLIVIVN